MRIKLTEYAIHTHLMATCQTWLLVSLIYWFWTDHMIMACCPEKRYSQATKHCESKLNTYNMCLSVLMLQSAFKFQLFEVGRGSYFAIWGLSLTFLFLLRHSSSSLFTQKELIKPRPVSSGLWGLPWLYMGERGWIMFMANGPQQGRQRTQIHLGWILIWRGM